jgi:hypothetical protein
MRGKDKKRNGMRVRGAGPGRGVDGCFGAHNMRPEPREVTGHGSAALPRGRAAGLQRVDRCC